MFLVMYMIHIRNEHIFAGLVGSSVNIAGCDEAPPGTADWWPCFALQHDSLPGGEAVQPCWER